MRANGTYLEAKCQFIVRNKNVLMNAQSPHKWWSTRKCVVFGLSSSLPPLVGGGGRLVCESVGKADLLTDHFDDKHSRESVNLRSLAIRLRDLPPLHSGRVRSGVSCYTWTLMGALTHCVCFLFFLRELLMFGILPKHS